VCLGGGSVTGEELDAFEVLWVIAELDVDVEDGGGSAKR